jgi:hypothetical protein
VGVVALVALTVAVAGWAEVILVGPQQLTPTDTAVGQPRDLTFTWTQVTGATGYEIQVAELPDMGRITHRLAVGGTSVPIRILAGVTRYWRVRAVDNGVRGEWSDIWSFQTAPEAPK